MSVKPIYDVTEVEIKAGNKLLLKFETGEVKLFDMGPLLELAPFKPLNNPDFFKTARIDKGTVVWSEEIDVSPVTLYEKSVPVA